MEQIVKKSRSAKIKLFLHSAKKNILKIYSICLIPSALKKVLMLFKIRKENKDIAVIILCEHIGDIISCEPVSAYLKGHFNKTVVWVVNERYKELVELFEDVDFIIPVSCVSEYIYMSLFLRSFEVHNLHFDKKICKKFFLDLRNENKLFNMGNYVKYGSLLQTFSVTGGLPMLNEKPHLKLDEKDHFPELSKPFCVIHIESNEPNRTWVIEKWMDLLSRFPNMDFVEVGLYSKLKDTPNCNSTYCGKLSLVESIYLVKKCTYFIGVDSCMAHVANALQKTSIVLMGRYHNYDNYTPFAGCSDNFKIVRTSDEVCDMPVEKVAEEFGKHKQS